MRDFAKISVTIWRSKKFRSLSRNEQLVYLYLLTSRHSNSVGCYELPIGDIATDTTFDSELAGQAIVSLSRADLISYDWENDIVLVYNWLTYNMPTNPKHAKHMQSVIDRLPKCELRDKVQVEFETVLAEKNWGDKPAPPVPENPSDSLSVDYPEKNGEITTETETLTDTETENQTPTGNGAASAPAGGDIFKSVVKGLKPPKTRAASTSGEMLAVYIGLRDRFKADPRNLSEEEKLLMWTYEETQVNKIKEQVGKTA